MKFDPDLHGPRDSVFAGAFRDAINAKDVSLSRLERQLHSRGTRVSLATLSYWRSGARHPEGAQSLAALADIEELLDLRPGALTALLRPHRTGPLGSPRFPLRAQHVERMVRETFAALGAEYPNTSRELTTHMVTDVDAAGGASFCANRSIMQSTTGTITSIPLLEMTPGVRTPAPSIAASAGGRIAALFSHASGEVHAALFALDEPLTAPDTAVLEWTVDYPVDAPTRRETRHAVTRQCRELLVWIRFDPDALPDWCEERVETPTGATTAPVALGRGASVHRVRRAFGPGVLELHWGYGRRDDAQPG